MPSRAYTTAANNEPGRPHVHTHIASLMTLAQPHCLRPACAKKEEPKAEAAAEPAAPAVDLAAEEQAIRTRSGEWMNYANSKDAASIANQDLSRPTAS